MKKKVLYIAHNHPSVRPGGAEAYAYELYREMRTSDVIEPYLLCKAGAPNGAGRPHPGTRIAPVGDDPNEYFLYTDGYDYDWFNGSIIDKEFYTKHVRAFLQAVDPDVVHVQHSLFLGYDLLREIKNSCPHAAILYTLHEFLPICYRDGQMIRTVNDQELCTHATPRRCNECFPDFSSQAFFMRKRFIQAQFELVDMFLVPSRLLLERYIAWGIPADRIRYEECGRLSVAAAELDGVCERSRLGFFGQLSRFKGVDVLLEAMRLLGNEDRDRVSSSGGWSPSELVRVRSEPRLWVHGANLDLQDTKYQQRFHGLIEQTQSNVTMMGKYTPAEQGQLMQGVDWVVVPSTWWENAPRVIQEAFQHGRPVICSDIGGMAEKVADGVDGLHFRTGDARSLAETISRAVRTPGLWESLHEGIRPVYAMDQHVAKLGALYTELLSADRREGVTVG